VRGIGHVRDCRASIRTAHASLCTSTTSDARARSSFWTSAKLGTARIERSVSQSKELRWGAGGHQRGGGSGTDRVGVAPPWCACRIWRWSVGTSAESFSGSATPSISVVSAS